MPATVASRGSSIAATVPGSGTWANTANAFDGAVGSTPATYATWTDASRSDAGSITIGGYFGASTLTATSVVTACSIAVRHLESSITVINGVKAQLQDSAGVAIGTAQTVTLGTTAATITVNPSVLPTVAQVNAGLRLQIQLTHGNNTTSGVFSLDFADITITYTDNVLIQPTSGTISFTGGTPNVLTPNVIVPTGGTIALTGGTALVLTPNLIQPTGGTITFTGGTTNVLTPNVFTPTSGTIVFAGGTPDILTPNLIQPTGGTITFTGGVPLIRNKAQVLVTGGHVVKLGGQTVILP